MILGLHTDTINLFNDNLLKELKSKEKEFTTLSEINVFTATWNVHGYIRFSLLFLSFSIFILFYFMF